MNLRRYLKSWEWIRVQGREGYRDTTGSWGCGILGIGGWNFKGDLDSMVREGGEKLEISRVLEVMWKKGC